MAERPGRGIRIDGRKQARCRLTQQQHARTKDQHKPRVRVQSEPYPLGSFAYRFDRDLRALHGMSGMWDSVDDIRQSPQSEARRDGGAGIPPRQWLRTRPWATGKRSEEHTSELQSLMRISYAVFCLKKKKQNSNLEQ